MIIQTSRLQLRPWNPADRNAFAAMNSDAEVMRDLGGPLNRAASDAKIDRYMSTYDQRGFCRWLIEDRERRFLGYAGVMPAPAGHPLGAHYDVGWRLVREVWGQGYVTEAARAALQDAFGRSGLAEVVSYTAPDNVRSQRVMKRLGLRRDPSRDFTVSYDNVGRWQGLVWVARPGWDAGYP